MSRFAAWLQETLVHTACDKRTERLLEWQQAPAVRAAHPREDHLIPLMVVVGAAENEAAATTYHQKDFAGGLTASSLRFGRAPSSPLSHGEAQ